MKRSKTALLKSAIALLLCISMFVGSTFAWFTDGVTSSSNIIQSGSLDLEMYWTDDLSGGTWHNVEDSGYNTIFDYDNWEPGYTDVRYIKLVNNGNLALNYNLAITPQGAVGKLAEVINVYFSADGVEVTSREDLNRLPCIGLLNNVMNGGATAEGSLLPAGETSPLHDTKETIVTIAMSMITTAGNEYQEKSVGDGFTITALATQCAYESDSFGNDYDSTANYPVNYTGGNVSASVVNNGGVLADEVKLSGSGISATVPAGVKLNDGVDKITLSVTPLDETTTNITVINNEILIPVDVHVDGVSEDNTTPIIVDLGAILPKYLNMGNYHLYHVENGANSVMAMVSSKADLAQHNQFTYDPLTGEVSVAMASFSEVAAVANTTNGWEGKTAVKFSGGTGTTDDPYLIANADELAYLNECISNNADYANKNYKLLSNLNFEGEHTFYPIGYRKTGDGTNKAGETTWYTYGGAFSGVFDGNGHTISNIYQNTWSMDGNYDNGYWDEAMGLFGYVNGGTIKNLTVDSFESDGEFTPTGVIAAYAANATFENIAITNCNPRVYNTGNGGIVGVGGNTGDTSDKKLTFTNITIDNTNKISALWGSWDVACGGIMGMFRGNSSVKFTNCHVAAQIDVYNDVCGNYQYYWYRYSGMMIGSLRGRNTKDENGYTVPDMTGITAENCTVHFGKWNDYYYCELVANSLASYTHDHQFSRLEQISSLDDIKSGEIWTKAGNFLLISGETESCYHIVSKDGALTQHKHEDAGEETVNGETVFKEDKTIVYLPFNQLFQGDGWGVKHIPIYNDGKTYYEGITILDREEANSVKKWIAVENIPEKFPTGYIAKAGDLFKENPGNEVDIIPENVQIFVTPAEGSTVTAIISGDKNWKNRTIEFNGTGSATISITDYYYCQTTTVTVNIDENIEFIDKFDLVFPNTEKYIYRVGNQNTFEIGKIFKAIDGVTIDNENVSISFENTSSSVTSTFTPNNTDWTKGTIKFTGTGLVKITIQDHNCCTPTELIVEVVDAKNATSAASAKSNNVVLLNDVGFSTIEVSNGYTLYGNGFTMTATNDVMYDAMGVGFVTLKNGTLDNVQIVCPNFSYAIIYSNQIKNAANTAKPSDSSNDARGNVRSAVLADGNSKIVNSYVHGGRAAIFLRSGNLLVDKSTISGGAAANIHAINAQSLTLRNATLIQKPFKATVHDTSKTIMGFSGLFECGENGYSTPLILEGTLIQDAWINEDYTKYVPSEASSVVNAALGKTAYLHDLDGDGTKESLNLGFTYIPQESGGATKTDNITDNRTYKEAIPYETVDVGSVLASAKVYSYKNTNGTSEDFTLEENYDPSVQGSAAPTVSFTDTNGDRVFETKFDTSDNRWESTLTVNLDKGNYTFNFDKLLVQKNGNNLDYTVKTPDGTIVETDKAVTLTSSGVTDYILTVTEGEVTHTVYFTLTATKTSIPDPEVVDTTGGTPLLVVKSKDSDWSCAIPALEGIKIKYYTTEGENVLDLATLTPTATGKQNGTNNYWETTKDGYKLKVTCGYIHDTKQIYGMPVVVNNGGNKMYFTISSTNGYVSTNTASRSVTLTYEFTDPNGKTLTFSKNWSFKYADYKTGKQYSYSDFCNGTLKEASSSISPCVTPDTLVTLADGTQKRIDEISYNDKLLVWNFYEGKYDVAPIAIIFDHGADNNTVIELTFSDGTKVKVVNMHQFYDNDLRKLVTINEETVAGYVGHKFAKHNNGNTDFVELTSYSVSKEYVEAWGIMTAKHYNIITADMVSADFDLKDIELFNFFEVGDEMKYDAEKMQSDIEKYGLYTYADFADYLTYEQFVAFNVQYFKIPVEKGLYTYDGILELIDYYLN